MNSTQALALTALKTQLENSNNLTYIKKVYEGVREDKTFLPCIILEPIRTNEEFTGYPIVNVNFRVQIFAIMQVFNADKQLVGDTKTKGILDIENDIKKAIGEDFTLGGSSGIETVNFIETVYDFHDYPRRAVSIDVEIEFKQNVNTRT